MPGKMTLSGAAMPLPRACQGLNRAQWRGVQRQWQRSLSLPAPTLRRPTPSTAPKLSTVRRYQSTTSSTTSTFSRYVYGTLTVLVLGFGYLYITDTRASIHQWLVVPSLRVIYPDGEDAHHAATDSLKRLYTFGLHPRERGNKDQVVGDLKVEVFGHVLDNPIGTSAGIDKNGEIPDPLLALGAAVVELGGVTPRPQEGNPRPRVFRIPSQNALINRYGLNSEGAEHVATILRERVRKFAYDNGLGLEPESERMVLDGEAEVPPGSLVPGKLLLVQVAKNKTTPDNDIDAVANDYVTCVRNLARYADVLVVNVSSPNTPGLRDLQATAPLTAILSAVVDAAKSTPRKTKPAVMVKVSPDEDSDSQIEGICSAVWSSGVDGVIVGNTTKKRPDPIPKGYILPAKDEKTLKEVGGYSGPQMFDRTLNLVKRYRNKLDQGPLVDAPLQNDIHQKPADSSTSGSGITEFAPAGTPAQEEKPAPAPYPSIGPVSPPPTTTTPSAPADDTSSTVTRRKDFEPKVIFATGGITNGEQCLQILNAGASVCQVYTAMMYGGVGTITRMKREMREAMRGGKKEGQDGSGA
jgi:dihydroorotate dehydrogenase